MAKHLIFDPVMLTGKEIEKRTETLNDDLGDDEVSSLIVERGDSSDDMRSPLNYPVEDWCITFSGVGAMMEEEGAANEKRMERRNGEVEDMAGDEMMGEMVGESKKKVSDETLLMNEQTMNLHRRITELETWRASIEAWKSSVCDEREKKTNAGTISEKELMEHIKVGVLDSGKYGCSRQYIREFLVDKMGIVINNYQRQRVNRIIRKLTDLHVLEERNNLFCVCPKKLKKVSE